MFFRKKKNKGEVPVERVEDLTRHGLSDREIIKKLKKEGYSYSSIEKSMLGAVKKGISDEPSEEMPEMAEALPAQELPELSLDELYDTGPVAPAPVEEVEKPEVIIEELIEGVIQEKWEKFSQKIKKYEDELERLEVFMRQVSQKTQESSEPVGKEIKSELEAFHNAIDDLEARVGGLERAFKQFLPSLTHNIESLSRMIHDLKIQRDMKLEEA